MNSWVQSLQLDVKWRMEKSGFHERIRSFRFKHLCYVWHDSKPSGSFDPKSVQQIRPGCLEKANYICISTRPLPLLLCLLYGWIPAEVKIAFSSAYLKRFSMF